MAEFAAQNQDTVICTAQLWEVDFSITALLSIKYLSWKRKCNIYLTKETMDFVAL